MIMDAGEICRSYAAAKNKNDQIKVLADLNDCSTQEILDVLTDGGMISGMPVVSSGTKAADKSGRKSVKKKSASTVRWTADGERELIRMYEAGVSSIEMAEKLGREQKQVLNKVHYLRKKGYIFTPDKPDKQPSSDASEVPETADNLTEGSPAKSSQEDVPARPPGINPLGMLFDNLAPYMTVVSAAVQFMDEQGKCWKMELTREDE